jgi:hypothetical protein
MRELTGGNAMLSVLAVVASFIVGGILIAVSSEQVQTTISYITARPSDFFTALWNSVFGAYDAMFRGAIFNYKATSFVQMIKPITETLAYATPITMAGLGLAVAFRSGLFNIGATGQIIFGAMFAGWVGIFVDLPFYLHFPLAVLAGIIGGGLFGNHRSKRSHRDHHAQLHRRNAPELLAQDPDPAGTRLNQPGLTSGARHVKVLVLLGRPVPSARRAHRHVACRGLHLVVAQPFYIGLPLPCAGPQPKRG